MLDSSSPKLIPGQDAIVTGRYALRKVLGSGAMGVVHRAVDINLGRTVAIKTIRKELVSHEQVYRSYRTRFYREASIFGALSHPNIVTLYDVGETEEGIPFLVMEYVPGNSLAELRHARKRLSLDQIMGLLVQLANGIDYAHAQDVLHRDIKPSNVLVGEGQEAKIADFGVAKLLGSEFTRSQSLFGTPGYMSPEQVVGKTLTKSTDIFSLGVVAFELLSGERPFPGKSIHSVLHKLVHADPILPAGLAQTGLDTGKWQVIFASALAKKPERRHSTASAFVSELVELFPGSWLGHLLSEGAAKPGEPMSAADVETWSATLTLWPSDDRS